MKNIYVKKININQTQTSKKNRYNAKNKTVRVVVYRNIIS